VDSFDVVDVVIVGAGPTGLACGIELKKRGVRVCGVIHADAARQGRFVGWVVDAVVVLLSTGGSVALRRCQAGSRASPPANLGLR